MPTDAAFLAAIRESPLDDLRRLVYADWLDEQGRNAEAEYLRLVAALAEPGTAVDVQHPHAVRLLVVAEGIDHTWREAAGGRFDLWFDSLLDLGRKINFIKCVRSTSGMGLAEAKAFSESLPKALCGTVPFEEACGQLSQFDGRDASHRIRPGTEVPSSGLPRYDVVLKWQTDFDDERLVYRTSVGDNIAAFGHLRRILAGHHDTSTLATTVPAEVSEPLEEYSVTLATDLLPGEAGRQAVRWGDRLLDESFLRGDTADPPFSGYISVQVAWQ